MENKRTEFDAIYESLTSAFQRAEGVRDLEGVPFVIVPKELEVRSLEHLLPAPLAVKASPTFEAVASFTEYVNRFKTDAAILFAAPEAALVKAVIDYHDMSDERDPLPSRCQHTAALKLKLSPEWLIWTKGEKRPMSQADFAEFLEDNLPDIAEPDGATVLEAAKHLEAKKSVSFKSGINLTNGSVQFTFDEAIESRGKGTIVIPTRFVLGIAPFQHGEKYRLEARLRYRINEGGLTFSYHLDRPHKVVEDAFRIIQGQVEETTGCPVLVGMTG